MESVVQAIADAYGFILWLFSRVGWLAGWGLLIGAAVGSVGLTIDVIATSTDRFDRADPASRPSSGTLLVAQVGAVAAIVGGIVLSVRDVPDHANATREVVDGIPQTIVPRMSMPIWQPVVAIVGGILLFLLITRYLRRRVDASGAETRLIWLTLGVVGMIASALAFIGQEDSAIPFVVLCVSALVFARSWFTLSRPEVRFDPAEAVVVERTSTAAPLVVQNLGMVYELPDGGSVEALKDVSFTLEPGRLLTLLGPSGCGKTTLLNIIAGFLAPTSGDVGLGDVPITGPGQDRGMVFQKGALFEWLSVNDNVGFGARMNGRSRPASREAVQGLLETVGLQGFGEKAVYELSGGMQQRVALARCLANDPDLILMDEPLGALDALTREKMQGLILDLWKETGKTIVLVTHSVEEALYLGDQLFVMAPRPGRIEKVYDLPFAERALTEDARELKGSPDFVEKREEILSLIWNMEEEIMGTGGGH